MNLQRRLQRIAIRLANDNGDLRHAVMDVCDEFLQVTADESLFPARLLAELKELRAETEAVLPRFRSHINTSVLFDREGMGQAGRKRAQALAQRIVAVSKSLERGEKE